MLLFTLEDFVHWNIPDIIWWYFLVLILLRNIFISGNEPDKGKHFLIIITP